MKRSVPVGEVRRLGDRAFLIDSADPASGRALARTLEAALAESGEVEVVCGFATVAVLVPDLAAELEAVRAVAQEVVAACAARDDGDGEPAGRLVTIPCSFDGPDLPEVAALAGCDPGAVVAHLTERPLTVAVVGFSPGFAYLDGSPEAPRAVPRRAHPRPRVPAGSLALANGHAAVYPTSSPGGWQLVGRTDATLFSPDRPPYAVLAPGDRVCLTVAAVGIPAAGPADPVSFTLANRLVGNAPGSGTLELTGGGTRLRCRGRCHVSVVGAAPELQLDGAAVPAAQVLPLEPGQVLEVGPLRRGCRTYVAVAGGILGPELFGSSTSDELCRLGAGPLVRGQLLSAGPWAPSWCSASCRARTPSGSSRAPSSGWRTPCSTSRGTVTVSASGSARPAVPR